MTATLPKPYRRACRYGCGADVLIAVCADGRWRAFDLAVQPPSPTTCAWRIGRGMTGDASTPGIRLHYCDDRNRIGNVMCFGQLAALTMAAMHRAAAGREDPA